MLFRSLPDRARWKGLKAIGLAINTTYRDGKITTEVRYYILSTYPSAKDFAAAVRATLKARDIRYVPGCSDLGDFDATSTDCTSTCPARNWRLAIVGGISASSPDAMRSNASVGRTHMLATVSLSSWCEVWPTGLAATKKRVSNRRVVSAFGVIQWLTHAIEVVSSRRPCSPARARTST